jgi:quercetin dioxygenase-like cupin family protein
VNPGALATEASSITGSNREVDAMGSRQFIVKPGERSAALSVIGTQVTVLVSAADSASQQITFQSGDEGSGPPPHDHAWDESFYVTRGQVLFACAGHTTVCEAGTLVHVPAGTVHAFSYGPGGGEMLEITGAGSKATELFTALDREIPPGPPDIPKILEVADEHGVRFFV